MKSSTVVLRLPEKGIKVVEQKDKLPVDKSVLDKTDHRLVHGSLFPSCLRCLIVGASGSGKTNLMLQLLQHRNGLRYANVYLISKSLFQPKYENLQKVFKLVPQIGYYCYNQAEELPDPAKCKPNSVIIFDDVSSTNEANAKLRAYFSTSRHRSNSTFLLVQSYSRVPKHLIRDNANFLIIFKQDGLNTRHIYQDYLTSDLSYKRFQDICSYCWKNPYGFLVIDTEAPINKGKLRSSLYHFLELEEK